MKIYTKTGDNGTTGLFAGPRVPKDHPRIQAYGAVDELNAILGLVDAALTSDSKIFESSSSDSETPVLDSTQLVQAIQSDLFSIGAQLATPNAEQAGMCLLTQERIDALESAIDLLDSQLEPLSNFILPGGSQSAAVLHLGRTVCRRAEREIVSLSHESDVGNCEIPIVYLNRLSDLLFVLARFTNARLGVEDLNWHRPQPAAE